MPHEITIRENGFAEIAFVGRTPWHGLGQSLDQSATLEQWRERAGLDWHIRSTPVLYKDTESVFQRNYTGQNVLYRSDNGAQLSIVSDRYRVVQPETVLEFFRDLVDANGYKLHTAGSLKGGRRIWALAEVGKVQEVVANDPIGAFLLFATSCDKGLATSVRFTSVRVVCANTLAEAERGSTSIIINHSRNLDIPALHRALGIQVDAFDRFMARAKQLSQKEMNSNKFQAFLSKVLMHTSPESAVEGTRAYKKIMELFAGAGQGSEMPGVSGTAWGAVNAVTEYIDHHRPSRSDDHRLDNAWFGGGERLKERAAMLAMSE